MIANFIYSTSYYGALTQIIDKINGRTAHLDVKHLLIVPERYTLLAEKMLYAQCDGSFDVEVMSLSRLFYRMELSTPLLSREGAIMLIRGMLPSIELKCFTRSASFRGFCEKLYDAINDFAANGITPDKIPTTTPKLYDLKVIYEEYSKRVNGKFVDSMGKLELLAVGAKTSEYLNNTHIYIANYDHVDKATRKVFDVLKDRALSYTECVVKGEPEITASKQKFCGEGAVAVKKVAEMLRYESYCGTPYEDMAVIGGNVDYARVKRIFEEFDIPCFVAQSKSLYEHPLSAFLLCLFECASRRRRADFLTLSKNIYTHIDKTAADKFENYVNARLVDYKGFYEPFADEECETVRRKLVRIVDFCESRIKSVRDAKSFGDMLEDIFSAIDAERVTAANEGTDSPIDKMRTLARLMQEVGIGGNFEFVSSVFAEGLKATKMSSLPYEGGVIVGDPAAFRGGRYKFLAVIGFDDGFLPQIYDDSSLIGDDEKEHFAQMERAEEINLRYERELAAVLGSADKILVTYTEPSGMVEELFGDAPIAKDEGMHAVGSKKHATELLINLVRRSTKLGEDYGKVISALYAATGASDKMFVPYRTGEISGADKLFFPYGTTSVSQLQSYFRCPFVHFADYGLRLKDRERGEVTPLDVGSLLHTVAEKVVRGGYFDNIEEVVDKVIGESVAGSKLELEANKEILDALRKEAVEAMKIYVSHIKKGKFRPIGQEIKFETKLGDVKLSGKIDMADEYSGYVRLIDYKTGDYKLDFGDVYYGKKIQLPLYMAAAVKVGYKKAAMFNYPFSYNWLGDRYSHRFSGFLLDDEDVINAVDDTFGEAESEVFQLKLGKNGKLSRNECLLKADEMDNLVDYAVRLGQNAIKEMKEGYAVASPCEKVCSYCSYKCLCAEKKIRKFDSIKKSVFKGEE